MEMARLERRAPALAATADIVTVADIAAEVSRLVAEGVEMIDEQPRAGLFGLQVAFIHPEAVQGVLLELVQPGGSL